MTDEERAEAVLENIRRRDELRRDIQILEQKLIFRFSNRS